jgi:hypothetical protein
MDLQSVRTPVVPTDGPELRSGSRDCARLRDRPHRLQVLCYRPPRSQFARIPIRAERQRPFTWVLANFCASRREERQRPRRRRTGQVAAGAFRASQAHSPRLPSSAILGDPSPHGANSNGVEASRREWVFANRCPVRRPLVTKLRFCYALGSAANAGGCWRKARKEPSTSASQADVSAGRSRRTSLAAAPKIADSSGFLPICKGKCCPSKGMGLASSPEALSF